MLRSFDRPRSAYYTLTHYQASDIQGYMPSSSKPIIITLHARRQMQARSVSEPEVISAVRSPDTVGQGTRGALCAIKTFRFDKQHQGRPYRFKKVEVRYVDEPSEIVVLTVISKFFN